MLSRERQEAVDELTETNRRLEATLAENATPARPARHPGRREAGVHDERQRMARGNHDTLAQGLTGIVTQLQAAEHRSTDWRGTWTAAVGLAREESDRGAAFGSRLRPQPLQTATLSEAIADVVDAGRLCTGSTYNSATTGTPRMMTPEAEAACSGRPRRRSRTWPK